VIITITASVPDGWRDITTDSGVNPVMHGQISDAIMDLGAEGVEVRDSTFDD
jgi:hypothetical protein